MISFKIKIFKLTLFWWQNSIPLRTWKVWLLAVSSGSPLGWSSNSSRIVWSTYSNTKYNFRRLRNTSIRLIRFSCLSLCKEGVNLTKSGFFGGGKSKMKAIKQFHQRNTLIQVWKAFLSNNGRYLQVISLYLVHIAN